MHNRGYTDDTDTDCWCGTSVQSMSVHLLRCPVLDDQCCLEDLVSANEKAVQCAKACENISDQMVDTKEEEGMYQ